MSLLALYARVFDMFQMNTHDLQTSLAVGYSFLLTKLFIGKTWKEDGRRQKLQPEAMNIALMKIILQKGWNRVYFVFDTFFRTVSTLKDSLYLDKHSRYLGNEKHGGCKKSRWERLLMAMLVSG